MVLPTDKAAGQTITAAHINAIATDVNTNSTTVASHTTSIALLGLVPTAVKTGAYTAAAQDFVPVDTTSGAVTITLPSAPADKTRVGVKMVTQGGTNTVSVARGGTDVFNKTGGSTTRTITVLNEAVVMQYNASGGIWYVYAGDLPLSQLDARFAATGDSRLSDARTPTAHASTHTPLTGSDPVFGINKSYLLAADATVSSTTPIDTWTTDSLPAGTYLWRTAGQYSVAAAAGTSLRLTHTFTGTQTAFSAHGYIAVATTSSPTVATSTFGASLGSSTAVNTSGALAYVYEGRLVVSVAGTLTVQIANSAGTNPTVVKAGSLLTVTRVA